MFYDIYHLGFLNAGQYITVKANQVAYLILIDEINLPKYRKNSMQYLAYDVLQLNFYQSYQIPYTGVWHMLLEVGELPSLVSVDIELNGII